MKAREMKLNVPALLDTGSGDDSDMSGIRSGQGDTSGYETGETWVSCFARRSSRSVFVVHAGYKALPSRAFAAINADFYRILIHICVQDP